MINLESNCEVMKYHCNDTNTPKKLKYREFDMTSKTQKRKFIFWVWNMSFVLLQSRHTLSDFTFNFHFHALEKATATHSSVLAWRIPGTGEPGGLPSVGSHRGDLAAAAAGISLGLPIWLSGKESTCQCRRSRRRGFDPWVRKIPWRRAWQSTPVFLPEECYGQRSLAGYSSQCRTESDTTERLSTDKRGKAERLPGVGAQSSNSMVWPAEVPFPSNHTRLQLRFHFPSITPNYLVFPEYAPHTQCFYLFHYCSFCLESLPGKRHPSPPFLNPRSKLRLYLISAQFVYIFLLKSFTKLNTIVPLANQVKTGKLLVIHNRP